MAKLYYLHGVTFLYCTHIKLNAVNLSAVPLNSPFEGGIRGMLFQWVTPHRPLKKKGGEGISL